MVHTVVRPCLALWNEGPGPNLRLKTFKSFLMSQRVGLWPPGCQQHAGADRLLKAGPGTSAHHPPAPATHPASWPLPVPSGGHRCP